MTHSGTHPAVVLAVDDNPADLDLTREIFREASTSTELYTARDGVEALAFLRRTEPHVNAPRPDLILLDLNMPRMNGCELLETIKRDPTLRKIPVIVLSTSRADNDIARSYDLHANCYIAKPVDFEQYAGMIKEIESFWLRSVELASH